MTTLSSDTRLPLYQRLRDCLAGRIAAQDWKAGDPIPSETELSAAHGISVGTVRKAIDCLVAEGLLDRQQGRGTYVRRARFNNAMFRFLRFQSNSGERKVPESRILQRKVVPAPAAVDAALQLAEREPVISLSRLRLVDGTPLLSEEIWLQQSRFAAILEIEPSGFGDLLSMRRAAARRSPPPTRR